MSPQETTCAGRITAWVKNNPRSSTWLLFVVLAVAIIMGTSMYLASQLDNQISESLRDQGYDVVAVDANPGKTSTADIRTDSGVVRVSVKQVIEGTKQVFRPYVLCWLSPDGSQDCSPP